MVTKKNNKEKILVIGDPHCNQSRKKAWDTAIKSIFKVIGKTIFNKVIITGDLFDKTPTIEERVMMAKFLKRLAKNCKNIILIKGTDTHEFTKGFYNFEDVTLLTNIQAWEELAIGKFMFGHYEVKGTRYVNGHLSESKKEVNPELVYMLGHIHQPTCSFDNVNYVGSIYKVSFAEIADQKRIAIIENGKVQWVDIQSRPMYEIELAGKAGKVKASGLKNLKESGNKEIDLKVKAVTDSLSLGSIHRAINKLKREYKIEYYRDDIRIEELKTDLPEDLNQEVLLKKYCEMRKAPYTLVEKEMVK
jgi:DNA repair exonuclease SbcCD nuclease subunit